MMLRSPGDGSSSTLHSEPEALDSAAPASMTLARKIEIVNEAARELGFAIDRAAALETVGSALLQVTGTETVAAYVVERGGLRGQRVYHAGPDAQPLPEWLPIPGAWQSRVACSRLDEIDVECVADLRALGCRLVVAAPLHHGAIFLGVMLLLLREDTPPDDVTLNLIHLLMTQLASFLDSRDLFSVLEDYALEMAQLTHLTRISTASMELERMTADISALLSEIAQADAAVALREGDVLRLVDRTGALNTELSLSTALELKELIDRGQDSLALLTPETSQLSPAMATYFEQKHAASLAVLPLVANEVNEGFILLSAAETSAEFERRAPMLEMAASQIALQIYNARGYQRVQQALHQRLDELGLIEDIARRITTVLNTDEIAAQVLRAALTATGADAATLTLATDEGRFTTIRLEREKTGTLFHHLPGEQPRTALPIWLQRVLSARAPQLTLDLRKSEPSLDTLIRSFAAAPLDRDSEAIGALSVESTTARRFTPEHLSFLTSLAGHAGISIENARLLEEHQYQLVALRNLQALAIELTGVDTTQDAARAAIDAAIAMLGADEGALYAYDAVAGVVSLVAARSVDGPIRHKPTMSRAALHAGRSGELHTRIYARGKSTTISLPIKRAMSVGSYALSLYFGHGHPVRQRDLQNLLILSSYVAGQLDNTSLNEQVRAASARMRAILDTTPSAILMLDRSGIVVDVNRSAEQLFNLNSATTLGKHISGVFTGLVASGGMGLSQSAITEFVQRLGAEPERSAERQFERSAGGATLHLMESISPVRNEAGRVTGHLLVYRDVSEQIRSAQYREQVTHMVIHDLRGPLWSIISGIDLAQDDLRELKEVEPTQKLLEISARSAQNLMRLVESLLDISRLEQGEFPLNRAPVSPFDLVESARAALVGAVSEAPITLTVECDPTLPLIDVDQDMLRRVLINLIDNALRHTPMQGRILMRAFARRGDIIFLVADSGPGIPLDERERVFERYRQIPQNRPQRGSKGQGLGLAFCKLAVEAHGGRISVEPHGPLPGAVFSVSIPIWRGD
ncbi:MAG TPA: ATP-binding protein [Candidatus Limnocylindrales bacterium]|nr:ATP-binding protein [Candidatus Limnocylindrales bacterium]